MRCLPIRDEFTKAAPRSSGVRGGASHGITALCMASIRDGGGFLLIDEVIK